MKKISFIVLGLMASVSMVWADAGIKFTKMIHDFGVVIQGNNAEYVFEFENTGNDTLILQNVRPGCGCTTPKYSTQPIPPGETGEIQVVFNSTGKHGEFNKTIQVMSNAVNNNEVLYIRGVIVDKMDLTSPASGLTNSNGKLDVTSYKLGQVEASQSNAFEVKVTNTGSDTLKVSDIQSGCQCLKYSFQNQVKGIAPGQSSKVKIEYTPREIGPIESKIIFKTNSKLNQYIELLVTGTVVNQLIPTSIMLEKR